MTDQHIIPTRNRLIQVFHAMATYELRAEKWVHRPDLCSPTLTQQITDWVRRHGVQVESASAPSLTIDDGLLHSKEQQDPVPIREHRMSISVVYSLNAEDVYDPERLTKPAPEAWFPSVGRRKENV